MVFIKETKEKEKPQPSLQMVKSIHEYADKLGGTENLRLATSSSKKVGDNTVIIKYPNYSINDYYQKFVKKFEGQNFSDPLIFESYSKIPNTDNFIPAMFWDRILSTRQ